MKYIFRFVPLMAICVIAFYGCNVTSHTEKATGVDFSRYSSFAWVNSGNGKKTDRSDNGIIDNNIRNAVSEELTKKGWKEVDHNPDVLLDYTIAVKHGTRHETAPVYSHPFSTYIYGRRGVYSIWHPSMLVGVRSQNIPFKEGELSVNMMDARSNQLVWQGWAEGELNSKTVTTKDITQQVKSMFRKF